MTTLEKTPVNTPSTGSDSFSADSPDWGALLEQYQRDGYVIVRQFYKPEEVAEIRDLFDKMHADGGVPGHYEVNGNLPPAEGDAGIVNDPLAAYPRVTHPHRFNARARYYLIHPRVRMYLEKLFGGKEPVATQSMYFFKAPGSRGQGMHQDNYYLLVSPGTCLGAWAAIDDSDAENGGLMVVPNTQKLELICPDKADRKESFTGQKIPMQKGMMRPVYAEMKSGDMLFFNGNVIHGSGPNRSKTRFRRSWICHYAEGDLEKISGGYNPLVRMDGTDFVATAQTGNNGPCGSESGWLGAVH